MLIHDSTESKITFVEVREAQCSTVTVEVSFISFRACLGGIFVTTLQCY